MSEISLVTGTGNGGYGAKVDANARLHTQGVTQSEFAKATAEGRGFNINTDWITLTDATDTSVLYFKNNENNDFAVDAVAVGLGTHTGGTATELVSMKIIKNPTTGTIIDTTPTSAPMVSNANFGSSRSLSADVYIGATADDTFTDGTDHALIGSSDFNRGFFSLNIVIPKGSSLGFTIDAPASTTSFPVYVALIGYVVDPEGE